MPGAAQHKPFNCKPKTTTQSTLGEWIKTTSEGYVQWWKHCIIHETKGTNTRSGLGVTGQGKKANHYSTQVLVQYSKA